MVSTAHAQSLPSVRPCRDDEDPRLEEIGTVWMVLAAAYEMPDTAQQKHRIHRAQDALRRRLAAAGVSPEELAAYLERRYTPPPERQLQPKSRLRGLPRCS